MVLRVLPVVYLLGIVMLGSLSLSAAVAPRTLYFHNLCTYPVRLGSTGGNTGLPCGGQGDCPDGTWCGDGHCYFTLPEPAGGFDMAPGATREIKLNGPVKTQTGQVQVRATPLLCSVWTIPNRLYAGMCASCGVQVWSGAVFASTGCDSTPGCSTAVCSHNGTCPPSTGPLGPRTLAEFTLQPHADDYYDVSIINGVNVPIAMAPQFPTGSQAANNTNVDPSYYCATPGAPSVSAASKLGACSWDVQAPRGLSPSDLLLVSRSQHPVPCKSSSDCSGGLKCGLQMDTTPDGGATPSITKACGTPLGWWTADEVCAWTSAQPFGAPFNCEACATLYGCSGGTFVNSCYSNGAEDTCCGCPDWTELGVKAPSAKACVNTNPTWTQHALPQIEFLKRACPTAYTCVVCTWVACFFVLTDRVANCAPGFRLTT